MSNHVKSRQFCSVCKDWLDMEIVSSGDGDDDDGVVWFQCPNCQGFLPKLKDALDGSPEDSSGTSASESSELPTPEGSTPSVSNSDNENLSEDDEMQWDSPAAMMAALEKKSDGGIVSADVEGNITEDISDDDEQLLGLPTPKTNVEPAVPSDVDSTDSTSGLDEFSSRENSSGIESAEEFENKPEEVEPVDDAEPIMEYAAMLAETDVSEAAPYRPWETYEVGQCIHHLAWGDCGVVVVKEDLPGGRKIIKCYFEEAGIVRLIEQAPR